jgi:cytochrome c oxidase assembly factor CtaG
MTGWELFVSAWDWEPSVVVGSAVLVAGYLTAVRFRIGRTTVLFVSGVIVMFLALVSPLDTLGDDYLFSAHMLQHILLDLVAPPLFVLGLPVSLCQRMLRWPPAAWAERILGNPAVAWTLGIGTLWIWHLPSLYDATLANETVHAFEHLTFLMTGTILFWPVFTPLSERRMAPLVGVIYLSLAAVANSLLGIIFTIATTSFYSGYAHPKDELGALSLIRNTWGLDQVADQQLGGVFMWAIGSVIFLGAIMLIVARWYHEPEEEPGLPSAGKPPNAGAPGSVASRT